MHNPSIIRLDIEKKILEIVDDYIYSNNLNQSNNQTKHIHYSHYRHLVCSCFTQISSAKSLDFSRFVDRSRLATFFLLPVCIEKITCD